jgi:hypothetical protein
MHFGRLFTETTHISFDNKVMHRLCSKWSEFLATDPEVKVRFPFLPRKQVQLNYSKQTVEGLTPHIWKTAKVKSKAMPVAGHGGLCGYMMSKIPNFLDSWLTDGCEVVSLTLQQRLLTSVAG